MFSIGEIARSTGIKVPTIRYYEEIGLLAADDRTEGNQRRYSRGTRDRLAFIRHARDLGLPLDRVRTLLDLSDSGAACEDAHDIARAHLAETRSRIARLQRLEAELDRLLQTGDHAPGEPCRLIETLGDHEACLADH